MTENERFKLGAVLLAAGGSTRLGRPKQLVEFEGETLLRRAARTLVDSVYYPVVVVLGAETDASPAELEGLPVYSVVNDRWREGMGSSIRVGLERLVGIEPEMEGVLIALCDQPRVTAGMMDLFAARFEGGNNPVVAAAYEGTVGVPALFSKELFTSLLELEGDKGARHLIRTRGDVATVDIPAAAFDIDTASDLD